MRPDKTARRIAALNPEHDSADRLGTEQICPLLLRLALPIALSMLIQAFYGIVDSAYVSQLGENALTAISLTGIPTQFVSCIASGFSVGMNTVFSAALGDGKRSDAIRSVWTTVYLMLLWAVVTIGFALFGTRPFMEAYTDDKEIIHLAEAYMKVLFIFCLPSFGQILFERVLQSSGNNKLSMISQVVGTASNLVLDPLFIFGIGGIPGMGIKGAAVATVLSQLMAAGIALYFSLKTNPDLLRPGKALLPERKMVGQILLVGATSSSAGWLGSITNVVLNKVFFSFSATVVATFGVFMKWQMFIQMPLTGLNAAMVTIMSYNFGAKMPERINQTFWWGTLFYAVVYVITGVAFFLEPDAFMSVFHPTEQMLRIARPIFRAMAITFQFTGINFCCTAYFQSTGYGIYSIYPVLCRQVFIRIPLVLLLASFGNVDYIWWAWAIAEFLCAVLSYFLMKRARRGLAIRQAI